VVVGRGGGGGVGGGGGCVWEGGGVGGGGGRGGGVDGVDGGGVGGGVCWGGCRCFFRRGYPSILFTRQDPYGINCLFGNHQNSQAECDRR